MEKNNDRKGEMLTIGPGLTIRGAEVQFGQRAVEAEPMEGPRMLLTLLKILVKCNMGAIEEAGSLKPVRVKIWYWIYDELSKLC